jgi:hypothetical protein
MRRTESEMEFRRLVREFIRRWQKSLIEDRRSLRELRRRKGPASERIAAWRAGFICSADLFLREMSEALKET